MNRLMNPRVLSAAAGAVFAVSLIAGAPLAQAAALTPVQIDSITNLLQAFGADATTIANVQAALEGTAPTAVVAPANTSSSTSTAATSTTVPSIGSGSCATLSQNLSVGSTGEDVSRLQTFLSKDKAVYPEGLVTGYYGDATRAAVEKWQESHGISTVGVVGPQTRGEIVKEMERECEGGSSSDSTASSTDSQSSSDATASSSASDNSSTSTPHSDN